MDPEERKLLEETHRLARENNHLLKAVRRYHWIGFMVKVLIWSSLILLPLYFYQSFLAPVLPASFDFQNLIESYQVGQE